MCVQFESRQAFIYIVLEYFSKIHILLNVLGVGYAGLTELGKFKGMNLIALTM